MSGEVRNTKSLEILEGVGEVEDLAIPRRGN